MAFGGLGWREPEIAPCYDSAATTSAEPAGGAAGAPPSSRFPAFSCSICMRAAMNVSKFSSVVGLSDRLREEAGMTQRQLGERLRQPQSWVFNCESANRRVDVAEFVAWCRACGASPVQALKLLLR